MMDIWTWVKTDWQSNRSRFTVEILAWCLSVSCSVTMAFTVPNPPYLIMYPMWITGCSMFAWAAWSRKSFGMLANYMLLAAIDIIGLLHLLSHS